MSEIHVLHVNRLKDLGIKKAINKSRLKVRLLEHFPDSRARKCLCERFWWLHWSYGKSITENQVAFRRWMLSGPELVRLQKQFEEEYFPDDDPDNPRLFKNHEQGLATQKAFQKQVSSLFKTFKKWETHSWMTSLN